MASYNPPIENLAIFDPSQFSTDTGSFLTPSQADKRYLKYPSAQGKETLQAVDVNGVATFNNIITSSLNADINIVAQGTGDFVVKNDTTEIMRLADVATSNIAIGNSSGSTAGNSKISIGVSSDGGANSGIAIGDNAGSGVNTNNIAIGTQAGQNTQGSNSIAMGYLAGNDTQGALSVAIGYLAGQTLQLGGAVAIGESAGFTGQKANAVAVGRNCGSTNQAQGATAFGNGCGNSGQGQYAVAVGRNAGNSNQKDGSVAIGDSAGSSSQGGGTGFAVAIGSQTAEFSQGIRAIAIGRNAGRYNQGTDAIAIGFGAGTAVSGSATTYQGAGAVAIGLNAGNSGQATGAVAIGNSAGATTQGQYSVAIGTSPSGTGQGDYSIAIGSSATGNSQSNNSIVINATGINVPATNAGCYVRPIRSNTTNVGTNIMYYNPSTYEIQYSTIAPSVNNSSLNDCALHTFIHNANVASPKRYMLASSFSLNDAVATTLALANTTTYYIPVYLTAGQVIDGFGIYMSSATATTWVSALYRGNVSPATNLFGSGVFASAVSTASAQMVYLTLSASYTITATDTYFIGLTTGGAPSVVAVPVNAYGSWGFTTMTNGILNKTAMTTGVSAGNPYNSLSGIAITRTDRLIYGAVFSLTA